MIGKIDNERLWIPFFLKFQKNQIKKIENRLQSCFILDCNFHPFFQPLSGAAVA